MNTKEHIIHSPRELSPYYRQLKFYTPIAMLFISLFIVVNIITQKIVPIGWGVMLTAGDFVYPLLYILSILLVEVYGYTMSRLVIWGAFFCNLLVAIIIMGAIALPGVGFWEDQNSFATILGRAPRILIASLIAFLIGEFIGTYFIAKVKVFTEGKYLWFRFMGATLIGQFIDSIIFTAVAFIGIVVWSDVLVLSISAYVCKVIFQVLLTPVIYILARFLKRNEHIDIFDRNTNFNPFKLGLQ